MDNYIVVNTWTQDGEEHWDIVMDYDTLNRALFAKEIANKGALNSKYEVYKKVTPEDY